jgi:hypothetical protein
MGSMGVLPVLLAAAARDCALLALCLLRVLTPAPRLPLLLLLAATALDSTVLDLCLLRVLTPLASCCVWNATGKQVRDRLASFVSLLHGSSKRHLKEFCTFNV